MHLLKGSLLIFLIILLNTIGWAETGWNSQADSARSAYAIALKQRSIHQIITALILLGDAQKEKNIDSAYLDYSYALQLADRFGLVKFRPQIFFETAMLHTKAGNYKTAVELFDSARFSALRMGNDVILSNVLNMLGTLYMDLWNKPAAKSMFENAYKLAIEKHLPRQAGVAYGNLACFIRDPDSSVNAMKTAIDMINNEPGPGKEKALIYINMANRMSNPDSAIGYYQKAIGTVDGTTMHDIVMQACNNMAYSYLDKGLAVKADELIQFTAIPIAESDSNFEWLASLYDTWADIKAYKHDYKGALALEKKAVNSRVQAELRKSAGQVRLLVLLLEVKKKDLLFSHTQLRVNKQEQDIRSLKFVVFILITVLLLIGVVVIGVNQRTKIKNQRKELELTKRKIDIHDYERKRLAMQLHDLTGPFDQKMTNRIGHLSFPDPVIREELMAEWKKISSIVHSISYQLNSNMVEDLPFPVLIESLVNEYRLIGKLEIEFEIAPGTSINSSQQVNLFCIIQELLTNAMKHVKTGLITFRLTMEYENLYLFYQDKGSGFDAKRMNNRSMGINNIFDRAILLGGKATLLTSPGKGTKWIIAVPQTTHE